MGPVINGATATINLSEADTVSCTFSQETTDDPPVLTAIGDRTVDEGEQLQFTISATDPDSDPLNYSASNLPPGATFDPATQTFTWTPGFGQSGSFPNVHFEVSDGILSDAENIAITVGNVPQPTTTSLAVAKTARRLKASGEVQPNQAGEEMRVTLYRKRAGQFRRAVTQRPVLDLEGEYRTAFRRLGSGRCRITSRFPGNAEAQPSSATKSFVC